MQGTCTQESGFQFTSMALKGSKDWSYKAMKIVVLEGYTFSPSDLSWGELEKLGELTVYDRTPEDKILERIGDAEIVYTNKTPLTRETFYRAPNIKWVGVLATGYNVVDTEAAK